MNFFLFNFPLHEYFFCTSFRKGKMIITQWVILARASGKLIFIHQNKVFDVIFPLTWLKLRHKKLSLQACVL